VREGNDLVHSRRISLSDALCGITMEVKSLDGRVLSLAVPEVIKPGHSKSIAGEGMPISKAPGQRGNLVIRFEVAFPSYISDSKKVQLRQLLA
jgi:DnaJ-class molecular chaperone